MTQILHKGIDRGAEDYGCEYVGVPRPYVVVHRAQKNGGEVYSSSTLVNYDQGYECFSRGYTLRG